MILRPMLASDQIAIMTIQQEAYQPQYIERWSVLLSKHTLYAAGCWVFAQEDEVVAYLFSHPGDDRGPPARNCELMEIPFEANCYYIHDSATRPTHQRRGIGKLLIEKAIDLAIEKGFAQIALVAVQGSQLHWSKFGFTASDVDSTMASNLSTYGDNAIFMRRSRSN